MNKKILLTIIPALMALSSCAKANIKPVEKQNDLFDGAVESTTACEDIFGAAEQSKGPTIRKMTDLGTESAYKIGYQIHFDEGAVVDDDPDDDDRISIRFIAAIKASYSTMVWKRTFTNISGTEKLTYSENSSDNSDPVHPYPQLKSNIVYSKLTNGGSDEMIAGSGIYSDYTGFIVYSLANIPYKDYLNYYLGLSLTLTPAEGDPIATDVYVVKTERNGAGTASADTFSIPKNKTGFFLLGTFGESAGTVDADATTKGSNAASFTTNFVANDNFIVVQKTSSSIKLWNGSCLGDGDANVVNTSGKVKVNTPAQYSIYLNGSNGIYHTKWGEYTGIYFRGAAGGGWGNNEGDIGISNSYRFVTDPDNIAVLLGVSLTAGEFKIGDQNWSHEWGYFSCKDGGDYFYPNDGNQYKSIIIGGADTSFGHPDGQDHGVVNIKCNTPGTYNIYLTKNFFVSIESAA